MMLLEGDSGGRDGLTAQHGQFCKSSKPIATARYKVRLAVQKKDTEAVDTGTSQDLQALSNEFKTTILYATLEHQNHSYTCNV